jgi:NAD+--asparagine ADP-ribosyltransferase
MSSPSPTQDIEDKQAFSISLTIYSKVKKLLQGKSTSKEEKSVKTKELSFVIEPSNPGYINFLKSMLQKHGQEDYEVTAKKHYPFKYSLPKVKGYFFYFLSSHEVLMWQL